MLDIERIPAEQVEWLEAHFRAQVFPIVTPQALDPAHPFPFIPNRGSGVMFDLVRLSDSEPVRELVMLPGTAPRFLRLPGEPARYVALETLLARFSALLFPGYRVKAAAAFLALRDRDLQIEAADRKSVGEGKEEAVSVNLGG